jgi:hypothetical protein
MTGHSSLAHVLDILDVEKDIHGILLAAAERDELLRG